MKYFSTLLLTVKIMKWWRDEGVHHWFELGLWHQFGQRVEVQNIKKKRKKERNKKF